MSWLEIPGWFTEIEAAALTAAVQASKGDVLEIGTYCGRSSTVILEALRGTGRRLWCVDLPPGGNYVVPPGLERPDTHQWVARLKEGWGPAVVYYRGTLGQFRAAHSNLRFGLAFVDGDHEEASVLEDIKNCLEIVTGPILFHDYAGNNCPGVERAVSRAGLIVTGVADSLATVARQPVVTFLTPVSRPNNLPIVQESLFRVMGTKADWEWIIIYDMRHARCTPRHYVGPDPIYVARAFTCEDGGQAGNCCRNKAIPHVMGKWIHHLDDDTIAHPGMKQILEEAEQLPTEIQMFRFPIMIGDDRGTNYDTGSWLIRTPAPLWNPDVWGGDKLYVDAIHPSRQKWTDTPGAYYNKLRG